MFLWVFALRDDEVTSSSETLNSELLRRLSRLSADVSGFYKEMELVRFSRALWGSRRRSRKKSCCLIVLGTNLPSSSMWIKDSGLISSDRDTSETHRQVGGISPRRATHPLHRDLNLKAEGKQIWSVIVRDSHSDVCRDLRPPATDCRLSNLIGDVKVTPLILNSTRHLSALKSVQPEQGVRFSFLQIDERRWSRRRRRRRRRRRPPPLPAGGWRMGLGVGGWIRFRHDVLLMTGWFYRLLDTRRGSNSG